MPVQTILDGPRNVLVKITNDAAATISVASLVPTCTRLSIKKVWFAIIAGGVVSIQWDATANVDALVLPGHEGHWDFEEVGALPNDAGAGVTGDIDIVAATAASYTLLIWLEKHGIIDTNVI